MENAIATYIAGRLPGARDVKISHLFRIPGGASRETWMFKAVWHDHAGRQSAEMIIRKDPPASLLETDREAEFAFYSTFYGTEVPVPRMRWLEHDTSIVGGAFFIMDRIPDIEAAPRLVLEPRYDGVRGSIGENMYRILGSIHSLDWRGAPAEKWAKPVTPSTAWSTELDHWEGVINANEISPQPVIRAGIRWLRNNPPPPAQRISVVHGDYRIGNVLYHLDGSIRGVVDWEMAHLGDPLEDFAWSVMEDWHWARDGRPGGVITMAEATRTYEASSGLKVDPAGLHWWSVFSCVKAQGIWLTGTKSFQEGRTSELILPVVSYTLINAEDEHLLRALGRIE